MHADPAIRYASLGVICSAFLGFLAVIIHGYWINANYAVPPLIATVLASALSIASTLLGVHVGTNTTLTGIKEVNGVVKPAMSAPGPLAPYPPGQQIVGG